MSLKKKTERFFPAVILLLMILLAGTVVFAAELGSGMMSSYTSPKEDPPVGKLTVEKKVKGLEGSERGRKFNFEITYPVDDELESKKYSLQDGKSVTEIFKKCPVEVNIREDVSGAEVKGYDFAGVSYHVKRTVTGIASGEGAVEINVDKSADVLTVQRESKTASDSEADAKAPLIITDEEEKMVRTEYLAPGEMKKIELPSGRYFLRPSITPEGTEAAQYTVTLVREYEVRGEEAKDGVKIVVEKNADIQITAINTYIKKGNLMVEKVWKGDKEEDRPDKIKVQLLRDGTPLGEPVTLKAENWSYTWKNLPASDEEGHIYRYSVAEIEVPEGYEVRYSSNNLDGVFLATASDASRGTDSNAAPSKVSRRIKTNKKAAARVSDKASPSDADEDEAKEPVPEDEDEAEGLVPEAARITITNTKPEPPDKPEPPEDPTGALIIRKMVNGGSEDAKLRDYYFRVEGPSYKDKPAEIKLKGGTEIMLSALEPGEYTVTEVRKDSIQEEGYTLSVTGEGTVTVNAGSADASVIITNTYNEPRTGSLFIKKTVGGSGDKEKGFHFTVSLKDENGNALPGSYSYSGSKEGTVIDGATVILRHDQSVTIVGLPENARYKVVEQEANADGYVTTLESGAGSDEGVITAGETRSVHFHNTKSSGGSNNPPPSTPSTPSTPSSTTPPRRGSRDPKPSNPNLPDVNDPNSPEQVTIVEDGVPTTYVKTWDPETEEYFYVPEEEVPMAALPRTGDPSHTGMLVVLMVVSLMGIAAFSVLRFRRKR